LESLHFTASRGILMRRILRSILFAALALLPLPPFAFPLSSDDAEILASVQAALDRSEDLGERTSLKIKCDAGILTLGGTADSSYALRRAVRRAGEIPGILDVVVIALVSRHGVPDSQILIDVQNALRIPSFSSGGVQASVNSGRVLLTGTTGSYSQKLLAENETSKVMGVVDIQNRIRVTAETNLEEPQLARRVLSQLSGGLTAVPGRFQVSMKGQVATLRGKVPLYLNRIEAEEMALSVPGVAEVDDRLVVDPSLVPSAAASITP